MYVFHVLSMKKIFQSTRFEMKQTTCVFNLTNVGSSMCVKEHSDLFINLMIEYAVKRANSSIYVPCRELPAWRENMIMIKPAWSEKMIMIKPAWQEKCGKILV